MKRTRWRMWAVMDHDGEAFEAYAHKSRAEYAYDPKRIHPVIVTLAVKKRRSK